MKIGIIYFSHMGHTQKVAENASEALRQAGFDVDCTQLIPKEPLDLRAERVPVEEIPQVVPYDLLVLGTPVHGGRMSAPMRYFLDEMPSIKGKKILALATHFFRKGWGAVQTIQQMQKICEIAGADFLGFVNVKWLSLFRSKQINIAVEAILNSVRCINRED